jgi:ketosteroid isomerase-like protein
MRQIRAFAAIACLLAVAVMAFAQKKETSKKSAAGGAVDKAYLQKIWDGWATLNPDNTAPFYAKGPHVFFDIAPVKYNSWDEYYAGVKNVLAGFQAATFKVNDDAQIHPAGKNVWITATIVSDMVEKSGKHDMSTMRWTAVFEKSEGKWLIVHEHVSEPVGQ